MKILEFGDTNQRKLILIHGFQCPYQMWNTYIEHYQSRFHVIVPVLPGHDPESHEELSSFDDCAAELENFLLKKGIDRIEYVYAISLGGLLAAQLMNRKKIRVDEILFESSPLLGFNRLISGLLKKQYVSITQEARRRSPEVLAKAVDSMVTKDNLENFIAVLQNMPDQTIIRYLDEVRRFCLPKHPLVPETKVIYCYGSGMAEHFFRKVAGFIRKNYPGSEILEMPVEGHCTNVLLHPEEKIKELDYLIL